MDQTLIIIVIAILAAICFASIGFVFVGGETTASKRVARVAGATGKAKLKTVDPDADPSAQRRKQVQDTLKGLEQRQKEQKKVSIRTRLERAGFETSVRKFHMISATAGLVSFAVFVLMGMPMLIGLLAAFAAGFGMPRWILSFLVKRRQKAFLNEFANAIDVIVRGVKSGLPINDCLRIIAQEAAEPVRTEFKEVVEGQRVGVSIEQSLDKVYERMPLPEVSFFQIVLAIQQKSGGNLSEALGNLSKVLRDRKKMRAKIQAISQEAKSSAAIIGALPPGVMLLIYMSSPDYMGLLFSTTIGNIILVGGALWMLLGILVMRKMINFTF